LKSGGVFFSEEVINSIKISLENWSNRKKTMFSDDRFLEKGIKKLELAQLI